MADLSQLKLADGSIYDLKDKTAREGLLQKAPAGFGLGSNDAKFISSLAELDTCRVSGWYSLGNSSGLQVGNSQIFSWAIVRVDGLDTQCVQTLTTVPAGETLQRTFNLSTWSEWEWSQPTLLEGIEYKTTETYMGHPVYVKLVNLGVPANGAKVHPTNSTTTCSIIRHFSTLGRVSLPYDEGSAQFKAHTDQNRGTITLHCSEGFTIHNLVYVWREHIWYVKASLEGTE